VGTGTLRNVHKVLRGIITSMKLSLQFIVRCLLGSTVGAAALVIFGPTDYIWANAAAGAIIGLPLFLALPLPDKTAKKVEK
jgi:hypothetical protein